ncbi:MAG TPA: four-carbon acid sugar kinase family protein [Acidobacteriaceae bacterium]|nr:four-carbon acid sugar kinase family protein [Acidobacteriaceae bacterium]
MGKTVPSQRVLIVADDLTGACDAAVAFTGSGRTVRMRLSANRGDSGDSSADVLALNTESRSLSPDRAKEEVAACIASTADGVPGTLLFQKIDSAARGNLAAEIDAALRTSGAALALMTPAFPDAGRTVAGGILTVRDWSGQNTTVDLRDIFRKADINVAIVPTASDEELVRAIAHATGEGFRTLICDAIDQADLDRLATAALRLPHPILWAGSSGLARALAAQLSPPTTSSSPMLRRAGRTLLFAGTPHPVTVQQIAHLEQFGALDSHGQRRSIRPVADPNASSEAIIAAFNPTKAAALILTGGDTASFVLRALRATSIRLAGEVEPGIPWGIIEGGLADGCTVVTKSGGFGQRDALVRAFEFCESESEAPLE